MEYACRLALFCFALVLGTFVISAQASRQNPSPMQETTRPHPRIEKVEVPGKRVALDSLKGATLFLPPTFNPSRPTQLIVHFHGAPWLIEHHIAKARPKAALITVQLGAGSSAYGRPFAEYEPFENLLSEAKSALGSKHDWSSVTLTGFSAGYGAIRAILRHPAHYDRIDDVLLLDGIHASYSPEGKPLAEGGMIAEADLDSFVRFAADASTGKKSFIITHSEIFPGTFASTTECVDHLAKHLGLRRTPQLAQGPMGMQQLAIARRGNFFVIGYAGNTAPDHIDHLHAMPYWFRHLRMK